MEEVANMVFYFRDESNNITSSDSFCLIVNDVKIDTPEPKSNYIEVPNRDGNIDLTEFFGGVRYNNRKITIALTIRNYTFTTWSAIEAAWHGKKLKLTFDCNPSFYYVGRVTLSNWHRVGNMAQFTLTMNAEPYQLADNLTIVSEIATQTEKTIHLINDVKPVIPEVVTDGHLIIKYKGNTIELSAGTYSVPALELKYGSNEMTIKGNANVTFKYREGRL